MKNLNRREFLVLTAGGAAAAAIALGGCENDFARDGKSGAKRPNIIYILADDLGYGDLGCYGQRDIKTSNIDRMASEGMRFTQHYAGSTVCAPSRCALMTGLHTGHATIRGNSGKIEGRVPLRPSDVTVAEIVKQAGYATVLVGKWGLGEESTTGVPNKKGFDYFFGYLNQTHAHNYYPSFLWRNNKRVALGNEVVRPKGGYAKVHGGAATKRVDYSHDIFTREALSFVDKNKHRPFFLYLAYTIPHANNESRILDRHGMEVPDYGIYANKNWPEAQKGHAAMITRMDRDIGRLFAKLKKLGLDEKTLVMFSSDNGPHKEGGAKPGFFNSGGPLRGIKRDLYEGGIRVPMIVRWPGKINAGSVSDHISAFWDILPSFAELAGVSSPENIDGVSMVATLFGRSEQQKKHKFLYWEFHEGGFKQAVRMGDWKAVRLGPGEPLELYNLVEDIAEKQDVAAQHPEVIARIETYLRSARSDSVNWPA
ncbi:MAG: arylsulfatase [Planctomycetota bacterium]|jgi:arylsulfatase A-like enzyme